jgi:hypothetical protein
MKSGGPFCSYGRAESLVAEVRVVQRVSEMTTQHSRSPRPYLFMSYVRVKLRNALYFGHRIGWQFFLTHPKKDFLHRTLSVLKIKGCIHSQHT